MRSLNSGLPEFSNIIVQVGNSRLGWRRPGIQRHALFWIPGSREDGAPRNDDFRMDTRVKPAYDEG
jgi:hypothetical protein